MYPLTIRVLINSQPNRCVYSSGDSFYSNHPLDDPTCGTAMGPRIDSKEDFCRYGSVHNDIY